MRSTLITLMFFVWSISISGQIERKSINFLAGYSENGHSLMTNFNFYPNENIDRFFELGAFAGFLEEKKTGYDIPIEIFTINAGYFTEISSMSSINKSFLLSIGIGGVIGNETLDLSNVQLPDRETITTKGGLIYGGYGAIQIDILLIRKLFLLARYSQFYHINSEVGKTKFMLGMGIAFKF